MRLLDLTLPTPEENLALDEGLLNGAETNPNWSDVLRLWESPTPFVVIGRASKRMEEVNVEVCKAQGVRVLRRCSGGTAVVAGPGCLMYAVVLSYEQHPELRNVDAAHRYVMTRMQEALQTLSDEVDFRGTCDLSLDELKFSGNALRCKRTHLLYHGTVLYDFPLDRIVDLLGTPPRQPDYRAGRTHESFVTNFQHDVKNIRKAICTEWNAQEALTSWPEQETAKLVANRYSKDAWNLQR